MPISSTKIRITMKMKNKFKKVMDKGEWYEKNRRQISPVLVNKKIEEEDRRGNYFWKNVNNREEDITKERYGLALRKSTDQKEVSVQIDKIELIIERAMEKIRNI